MEDYRELGTKYLSRNKKRSFITVLGCFIVATGLFTFLNTMVCWVEKCRIDARKEDDYEIVILTEDKEKIEQITNEDFVTSAYIGKEYSWLETDEKNAIYANALHINVREKLLMNYYSKYIAKKYGVETEMNDLLSWTYLQDEEGVGYLMILGGFFIAFILAIIGVGVLRNNISISALERVKDYGNLRCIGATKKQIKAIVYRESFFLESVGIAAGVLMGFVLSIPICNSNKLQFPIGFHIIPIIILCIAFYGDMYFAIDDGLKKVLSVSPSEAVRGNYRIKAKGIKRRSSGIWGLIFGVEGDYAYKNIKRNNGRFIKTVMAMAFGMIIVVVVGGLLGHLFNFYKALDEATGYYQQYIYCEPDDFKTIGEIQADLYSPEALKIISDAKGIESPKFLYYSTLYTAEDRWVFKNVNERYYNETVIGKLLGINGNIWTNEEKKKFIEEKDESGKTPLEKWREVHPEAGENEYPWTLEERTRKEEYEKRKKYRAEGKGLVDYASREPYDEKAQRYEIDNTEFTYLLDSKIDIYGYDEEDYARYKERLMEGTTDLSENGILLINQGKLDNEEAYNDAAILLERENYKFLDVKLGDEITIVDPIELRKLVQEEKKNAIDYDNSIKKLSDEWKTEHKDEVDGEGKPVSNPYDEYSNIIGNSRKQAWIINSAREKLVEEGKCKTYKIEGIIDGDPNWACDMPTIVVPLEKYYEITGKTEADYNGMKFHVSNKFSRDFGKSEFRNAVEEKFQYYYDGMDEEYPKYDSITSSYLSGIELIATNVRYILEIVAILVVLIIVSLLNTMNVTISGLQTRRNEFAQLRSLGMTKKGLLKAVILEGGIVWIISTLLGILLGIGIEYILQITIVRLIINSDMYIFWPGILISSLLGLVVLCGSNYVFFKQMNLNIAEELTRSGE